MSDWTEGVRVELAEGERFATLDEGEYGLNIDGIWWVRPPGCLTKGLIDNFPVKVHPNGTITTERVVRCRCGNGHMLVKGVWQKPQPLPTGSQSAAVPTAIGGSPSP